MIIFNGTFQHAPLISRRYSDAVESLYSEMKLQCQQCGFRYHDTPEGHKKMSTHLDWHFRQNRKGKEKTKTTHSRDWFLSETVNTIYRLIFL